MFAKFELLSMKNQSFTRFMEMSSKFGGGFSSLWSFASLSWFAAFASFAPLGRGPRNRANMGSRTLKMEKRLIKATSFIGQYRGFRNHRVRWGWPFCPLFPGNPLLWTFFNGKFQFGDCKNVCYSQKSVISESGTSKNLCNHCIEQSIKELELVLDQFQLITTFCNWN